jgi:ComF family protein
MTGLSVRQIVRDVIDFCVSPQCASCNTPAVGGFLCESCMGKLDQLVDAPACGQCAMPLAEHEAPCPYCRGKGVARFGVIVALGRFDEPLKDLIHQMKYQRHWPIAEHLADRLARTDRAARLLSSADRVVPVPLHRLRHLSRGYNQAEVIARRLAGNRVIRPVVRTHNTPTQTNLHSTAKRFENLRGAFRLTRPKSIAGQRVVVVDDVMTSGATLQSLARTLAAGQPQSLDAIVLAIADPKGRKFEAI